MVILVTGEYKQAGSLLGFVHTMGRCFTQRKALGTGAGEETPDRDNSPGGTILLYLDKLSNTRP